MESVYIVFTRMPGESYFRRIRSLFLCPLSVECYWFPLFVVFIRTREWRRSATLFLCAPSFTSSMCSPVLWKLSSKALLCCSGRYFFNGGLIHTFTKESLEQQLPVSGRILNKSRVTWAWVKSALHTCITLHRLGGKKRTRIQQSHWVLWTD